jgi:4-diphosphocytidyl-2C-methyl-D-erythritol kinase
VLLALPVLARRRIPIEQLMRMAADLGSDVPFFLIGGMAAAWAAAPNCIRCPMAALAPAF